MEIGHFFLSFGVTSVRTVLALVHLWKFVGLITFKVVDNTLDVLYSHLRKRLVQLKHWCTAKRGDRRNLQDWPLQSGRSHFNRCSTNNESCEVAYSVKWMINHTSSIKKQTNNYHRNFRIKFSCPGSLAKAVFKLLITVAKGTGTVHLGHLLPMIY